MFSLTDVYKVFAMQKLPLPYSGYLYRRKETLKLTDQSMWDEPLK